MTIEIYIIGLKGQLRSKSLEEWASSVECPYRIEFVEPIYYTRVQVPRILELYTGLHYGNRLTDGEWGCSMAHLRAQILALSMSAEWAFFLEDDARLSNNFAEELRSLVTLLPLGERQPLGVQCFGSKSTSGPSHKPVSLEFLHRAPPIGAVGYLLNRATLDLVTRSQHRGHSVGKADFPAWGHQVAWATANPTIVFHEENSVSLVGPRKLASRPRGALFKSAHALTRLLLSLVPLVKIRKRLAWELDFILRRTVGVQSNFSRNDKSYQQGSQPDG